jgi:hypothetical protein
MGELNGWTKLGDKVEGNGKWRLLRHGGKTFDTLKPKGEWPPEQAEKATREYQKLAETVNLGGLWLVSPDGTVAALIFRNR